MKFNINDNVLVRLTQDGIKQYEKHHYRFGRTNISEDVDDAIKYLEKYKRKRNGYYCFQLWDLMNIFGPEIYMGGPQFFKNNEIIIEKNNL